MRNPRSGSGGPRNIIAARLRKARFAVNLTQDQLSGRLALHEVFLDRVAIAKVENGQRCVFDFELPGLARALNVDVMWLLGLQATGGPKVKGGKPGEF